jgi:hypothetical protein
MLQGYMLSFMTGGVLDLLRVLANENPDELLDSVIRLKWTSSMITSPSMI